MNPTDAASRAAPIAALLFLAIAVLIGVDVVGDYRSGTQAAHLVSEGVVMALSLAGAVLLWQRLRAVRLEADRLTVYLEAARREAARFREEARTALQGLGEAIDRQFVRWQLTPAEKEVGLLLLKGLSHKEVADARSISESTVRQQALAVYRKAGLRSRSELSAFFLEDLLLPSAQR